MDFVTLLPSIISGVVGGVIIWQIKKMDARITRVEDRTNELDKAQAQCRLNCNENFVGIEQYLREAAINRQAMQKLQETLTEIKTSVGLFEKLPRMVGEITKNVLDEVKDWNGQSKKN